MDGKQFDFRFACLVWPPGDFRATDELSDRDTLITTIYGQKDGEWVNLHAFVFKRRP